MYKRKRRGWISVLSFIFLLSVNMYTAYLVTIKQPTTPAEPVFRQTTQPELPTDHAQNFDLPLRTIVVSSPFGNRENKTHSGIDFAADMHTPILAASDGIVRLSDWVDGYGYTVILTHENGFETLYAHCDSLSVSSGVAVQKGTEIAKVGSSGNSTGPHLHFEMIKDGTCVDPALYITLPVS